MPSCPRCDDEIFETETADGEPVETVPDEIVVCESCWAILVDKDGEGGELRELTASEWVAMDEAAQRAVLEVVEMVKTGTVGKVS